MSPELRIIPVGMTKDELLAVLDDIRAAVAADDSFEGMISYEMPDSLFVEMGYYASIQEAWPKREDLLIRGSLRLLIQELRHLRDESKDFNVRATYRIGNSAGQGGVSVVGEWREVEGGEGVES